MAVFFDIEAGLQKTLQEVTGAPLIRYENATEEGDPVVDVRYWRPTNLPNRSSQATLEGCQIHPGIFQVDIFIPVKQGLSQLMLDMDAIFNKFKVEDVILKGSSRIQITSVGRGRAERDQSWYMGFVEIEYRCYSSS